MVDHTQLGTTTTPAATQQQQPVTVQKKCSFSVSHCSGTNRRQHPTQESESLPQVKSPNEFQQLYSSSTRNKKIAHRVLLLEAAKRDIAFLRSASKGHADQPELLTFASACWKHLLNQFDQFWDNSSNMDCCEQASLEAISSLGVWYNGANLSLPLRQFLVVLPSSEDQKDGQQETMTVLGITNFTYSNFIMHQRLQAQQSVLQRIMMEKA